MVPNFPICVTTTITLFSNPIIRNSVWTSLITAANCFVGNGKAWAHIICWTSAAQQTPQLVKKIWTIWFNVRQKLMMLRLFPLQRGANPQLLLFTFTLVEYMWVLYSNVGDMAAEMKSVELIKHEFCGQYVGVPTWMHSNTLPQYIEILNRGNWWQVRIETSEIVSTFRNTTQPRSAQ